MCQQRHFWTQRVPGISVADMTTTSPNYRARRAKPTAADTAAAARLRELWEAAVAASKANPDTKRITQEDVASVLGVSQSAVSQYLTGQIPLNYAALIAFSQVIGCDPESIRSDLREQRISIAEESPSYRPENWVDIEASTQAAALGDGAELDEYAETHRLKFRADSLSRKRLRPGRLQVFYGRGDSMEPRIRQGDALLVNTEEQTPIHDAIFMVRWEGQFYAKRLKKLGRQWFMCSDNGSDPKWRDPVAVEPEHDFEVIGRVRWIGSWED